MMINCQMMPPLPTKRYRRFHFILFHASSYMVLQARLDDELEGIAEKITEKYPAGICRLHPNICCFHYRPSDLHFELDRSRTLVWAAAIRQGNATYEKIPLGSNFFKANQALKKRAEAKERPAVASDANASDPAAPAPALAPVVALTPASPFGVHPYMFTGMPFNPLFASMPFMGYPPPISHPTTPSHTNNYADPPSSPVSADMDVATWCAQYQLDEEAEAGLDRLGFAVGDNLKSVTAKKYTDAGFKPLAWRRVLKAYHQFRRDHKKH